MDQMSQGHNIIKTLTAKRLKTEEPFDTQILPDELWLEIFCHLSAQDVITNVNKVCTHFHYIP